MQKLNVTVKGRRIKARGGKCYLEFDNMRLVCEDGEVIGWYRPEVMDGHINELARRIHENAVEHGWWEDDRPFSEIVALCHSELSEALEAARNGELFVWDNRGKPDGVAVEMIDCIIRILDWCAKENLDVEEIVLKKHEYNKKRPYKHGKAF